MIEQNLTMLGAGTVRGIRRRHRACVFVQAAGIVALLLLTSADDARAESFGRWFFTIEERRILDDLRDAGEERKVIKRESGPTAAAPVVDVISFDGKVERSDGGSTVWVNGRPVFTGNRTAEGIRVEPSRGTDGEARFVLPRSATRTTDFSLRAGQKIAVQNGRKFDAFEARPDEDAESVLRRAESSDSEAGLDEKDSPGGAGGAAARVPSPGS